ncbi:hypothetical protein NJ76_23940 [Rhodococcus sp. IITR03]|nr:hypothetical protein NJ76_23940 [Rhodococcus sp. IITR03]
MRSKVLSSSAEREVGCQQRKHDALHHVPHFGITLQALVVSRDQRLGDTVMTALTQSFLESLYGWRDATSASLSVSGYLPHLSFTGTAGRSRPHLSPLMPLTQRAVIALLHRSFVLCIVAL